MNRRVTTLGCGLLAKANESRANEHLQFRLAFHRKLVSGAANSVHKRTAVTAAIKLGEIRDPDRDSSSGFRGLHGNTAGVIQ